MNRLAVLLLLLAGVTSATAARTHDHVNGRFVDDHVNGQQFADEHVVTYDNSRAGWRYCVPGADHSVVGTGDPGGQVERLDYSSTGDFANGPGGFAHDAQPAGGDSDIDLLDFASLQVCFGATSGSCLVVHDYDTNQAADGVVDADDALAFEGCWNGPDLPPTGCLVAASEGRSVTPTTGLFALHGRPLDVLPDGKILLDFRARVYDPQHGRWLQRDPLGYVDGGNLYESFGSNAQRFTDPTGTQDFDPCRDGFFGASAADCRRMEAAAQTYAGAIAVGASATQAERAFEAVWNPPALPFGRPADREYEWLRFRVSFYRNPDSVHYEAWPKYLIQEDRATFGGALLVVETLGGPPAHSFDSVLSGSLTAEDRYELGVLGPLQGAAFAGEGLVNVGVDLGNLGLAPVNHVASIYDDRFHVAIPSLNVANGVFLDTPESVAAASRFLGGNALASLTPLCAETMWRRIAAESPWIARLRPVNGIETMGRGRFVDDLSGLTGKTAVARNRAIEAVIAEDFQSLGLTYQPRYSPYVGHGIAKRGVGTHIGSSPFGSRAALRETIVHEELHHRWWSRGIFDPHPVGSPQEARFYEVIRRYERMRGWK